MVDSNWNIPQELDKPMRIAFFTQGELAFLVIFVFLGIIIKHLLLVVGAALAVIFILRRFSKYLKGLSPQVLAYWFLNVPSGNLMPKSWKRSWYC